MSFVSRLLSLHRSSLLAALFAGGLLLPAVLAYGIDPYRQRRGGGHLDRCQGMVRQHTVQDRAQLVKTLRGKSRPFPGRSSLPAEMRKISLRGLEAALRGTLAKNLTELPDEIVYLAGMQRIQYVLVYPEQHDIVLAGPGEGWKVDDAGHVVGVTTGRPVLLLEDLLVALQAVDTRPDQGISVSIDPTAEGRRGFEQFMNEWRRKYRTSTRRCWPGRQKRWARSRSCSPACPIQPLRPRAGRGRLPHEELAMKLTDSGVRACPASWTC